jgi:hypothetical protein
VAPGRKTDHAGRRTALAVRSRQRQRHAVDGGRTAQAVPLLVARRAHGRLHDVQPDQRHLRALARRRCNTSAAGRDGGNRRRSGGVARRSLAGVHVDRIGRRDRQNQRVRGALPRGDWADADHRRWRRPPVLESRQP